MHKSPNLQRVARGLLCLSRVNEVFRCFFIANYNWKLILAYLGVIRLQYPTLVHLKQKTTLKIYSWEDLTTLWVVWFGSEYSLLDTDRKIVDLGANIGAFTIFAAQNTARSIVAVEPYPETFDKLVSNIKRNHNELQVDPVCSAVDHTLRCGWMSDDPAIPSYSRQVIFDEPDSRAVRVSTITIAETAARLGGVIDFLKIDIEGHEYELLEKTEISALRTAKRIAVEYHEKSGHIRIKNRLEKAGFTKRRHRQNGGHGTLEFLRLESGQADIKDFHSLAK